MEKNDQLLIVEEEPHRIRDLAIAGVAEAVLSCGDLFPQTLAYFTNELGFRVELIFPAEKPEEASLSGYSLRVRLVHGSGPAGRLRLTFEGKYDDPSREVVAPNGTVIELINSNKPIQLPDSRHAFLVTNEGDTTVGRAGMLYRDLIPGRLGGRYVASHISIPDGGPVADWVHFHKVHFQLIFCHRGWVRLVYEDQGPPFVLNAGDCVIQPPQIRHRVLESSKGLEVVELGCPAVHDTIADHSMELPTAHYRPDREFNGQLFLRHVASEVPWKHAEQPGFERRDTGIALASKGVADGWVLRKTQDENATTLTFPPHNVDLFFCFVLDGSARLSHQGDHSLSRGSSFVAPPDVAISLENCSCDLSLLVVTLPALA